MGFDNECIVNIQSLAGEYFCPVCRLLVYPNEALQSQCTHLYCKPCLTYIVSTTRACPYDGYLVTEADSKPLSESNKTLADTIGKVAVHCLYHRSGCTWQGSLFECTSHCSGCAFGNSPVVCNRCGIQIVHRQVQEHAQNCPGVQNQVQQSETTQNLSASGADASADPNQAAAQVGGTASQALTTQTVAATSAPGQDLNMPANTTQTQPSVLTVVQPNAEQWHQQQQYQQYYQQYSGYDPYQHQYPYQSTVAPQYQQYTQAYGHPHPQSQSQPQPQALTQAQPQPQPQTQAQGHSQPIPHAPVALQSQNQMPVSQQQQVQPTVQQHSQIQSLGNPSVHCPPQPQHYPHIQSQPNPSQPQSQQPMQMPQYEQPHPQMQQPQPQVQQPAQNFPISNPQSHQRLQPHAPVQHIPQSWMHPQQPNVPGTLNLQPQTQNTSAHAVTGHHSYPQPQAHHNMQMGAPQRPMNMHHPQVGPLPHSQQHGEMQNQFPQQFPIMRPHQSHAMFPNQQQPALFPAPVQGQNIPPQQQQVYGPGQQPAQSNHRPVMQAVQQPLPPQSSVQQQLLMPSYPRPQGPAPSFPEHAQTYPQQLTNVALSHNPQSNQSQNAVGRPLMPNHTMLSQPFAQTANASLVRPLHTGAGHLHGNQKLMVGLNSQVQVSSDLQSRASDPYGKQGALTDEKSDSGSGIPGKSVKDMNKMSVSESEVKIEKDMNQDEIGNGQKGEGVQPVQTIGMNTSALENGNVLNKNSVKEESDGGTWQPSIGDKLNDTASGVQNNTVNEPSGVKEKEIQDDHHMKNSSLLGTEISDSQPVKQQNDDRSTSKLPLDADNTASAASQTLGTPQGPGVNEHINITPKATIPLAQSFPTHSSGIPSQQNQGQAPLHPGASNFPSFESGVRPRFGAGDMHAGTTNIPPHASESHPHHRTGYLDGPHGLGLNEERFKPFPFPGQQNIERREFEGDLKRFPAPYADAEPISKYGGHSIGPHNRGSHGFNYSGSSKLNSAGAVTSRLFPPSYSSNDVGERPVAFHDAMVKSDTTRHTDYLGIGSRHGLHLMDGLTSRSPVGEHAEMYLGRAGVHSGGIASKSSVYDFDGRDPRHFGDSFGTAFRDSRFSHLPSHFRRGEFDGPGSMRIGEHPRGEFIGQDDFSGSYWRGDRLGPHNMPRHLPLGEPLGFGAHAGHVRASELGGPQSFESFNRGNRSGHPQLGEPGFRSRFSLPGFPNDGGLLTGDIGSFDNLKRRKAGMGWCRICKVDCESVEGLDLHSQMMEHQRMAMDMVKSIKQNAKKRKLTPSEQSSIEDGSKSRTTSFEGDGNKH